MRKPEQHVAHLPLFLPSYLLKQQQKQQQKKRITSNIQKQNKEPPLFMYTSTAVVS
jgi:hypothetical protein